MGRVVCLVGEDGTVLLCVLVLGFCFVDVSMNYFS